MAVILLPLVIIALWLLAHQWIRETRLSMLAGLTIFQALLVAMTEALSLVNGITAGWVAAGWMAMLAAAAAALVSIRRRGGRLETPALRMHGLSRVDGAMIGLAGIIAAGALISGYFSAPNNWDSMTYRLPRVAYWIQHRNLEPFPTHITRQIELNPGAGYTLLHLQLLTSTYRLFFLPQWLAAIIAGVAASLIARWMGGSHRSQLYAGLALWSIPMLVLQASSTQDDLTVGSWLLVFVAFAMRLVQDGREPSWGWAALTGAALGVALVIKGTANIFAFPFCVLVGLFGLRHFNGRWMVSLAIISLLAIVLPFGPLSRNITVFGNPYGGPQRYMITNQEQGLDVVYTNGIRSLAVNFVVPYRPWNRWVQNTTNAMIEAAGVDKNDYDMIFPYAHYDLENRFENLGGMWHEDWAPNPLSTLLGVAACAWALLRRRLDLCLYTVALLAGCYLFFLIFRWQPWITRLQLPFFMLTTPLAVVLLQERPRLQGMILGLLLATSIPTMLLNHVRPAFGSNAVFRRGDDYNVFASLPESQGIYTQIAGEIHRRGYTRVGIVQDFQSWEWPLHYYYISRGINPPWFGHRGVFSEAKALEQLEPWRSMQYDALILIDRWPDQLSKQDQQDFEVLYETETIRFMVRRGAE